jgi:hypothetical protein
MARRWYCRIGGQQFGPVPAGELKRLADAHQLQPSDLVWSDGMKCWRPARRVKGLFGAPTAPPPHTATAGAAGEGPDPFAFDTGGSPSKRTPDGFLGRFAGRVKAAFTPAQRRPYVPPEGGRELARLSLRATTPSTLLPAGTLLRLFHEGDDLVLVAVPSDADERVVYRYPVSRLTGANYTAVPDKLFSFLQSWHNTKYGFWEGRAATNLQGTPIVPGISLGFHAPDHEHELHVFTVAEAHGSPMPIMDCCSYLQSLILKRNRGRI